MKFCAKKPSLTAGKTAAPAVIPKSADFGDGFTLIEVLTVVVLIGILSALAYSSLMGLIFTNRAKETAQTIRTFAERALAEGKRQEKEVTISLDVSNIIYSIDGNEVHQPLGGGFSANDTEIPDCEGTGLAPFNNGATSQPAIGLSIIAVEGGGNSQGYFVACGYGRYCGAAVKVNGKNSFVSCIKRGANAAWEPL